MVYNHQLMISCRAEGTLSGRPFELYIPKQLANPILFTKNIVFSYKSKPPDYNLGLEGKSQVLTSRGKVDAAQTIRLLRQEPCPKLVRHYRSEEHKKLNKQFGR